jgi:selenocysteine lyase/cysteine desulfurase
MTLDEILQNESLRLEQFPVCRDNIFMAHAGVSPLPKASIDAMQDFMDRAASDNQEGDWTWPLVREARERAAQLIGANSQEIALLGPTSLGLNLVANGLDWSEGDEVVFYMEDYPADVYPWLNLRNRGVKPVALKPDQPGVITWELVESVLTERTRLVAMASCSYLAGYRIDIETIGRNLRERNILFSLDGIQTIGAFPTPAEYCDFISADSHKWMLGPVGAGIFYVKEERFEQLKPTLLGSWNVKSPEFVAQPDIKLEPTARRYEPGSLNLPGIFGMLGSMNMLLDIGLDAISERLLEIRVRFMAPLREAGFGLMLDAFDCRTETEDTVRSAILSLTHPDKDMKALFHLLAKNRVKASLRMNRAGEGFLRLSPHFYNTNEDIDRVVELLAG